jgi:DNA-binding response OmpR family regulator
MNKHRIHLTSALKFLIVDDSRAIQAIIRRAIGKCGYEPIEIETALNGEQGLDAVGSFTPDLVITDWHMPRVSGLEMVQAMRQMGHQKVRVGFVTTERTPALMDEAVRNGAMFILHKPFDDAELVNAVTAAVQDLARLRGAGGADAVPRPNAEAPVPTPDMKGTQVPVRQESLQLQLTASLGKIPYRLIVNEAMTVEKLTPNILLGLYGANHHKGVYAIGLLDANAVSMVGGGAARKSPAEVRAAMAAGMPDSVMLARAHDFLHLAASCLNETAADPASVITLAKASIVKSTFSKLVEVLAHTTQRADFRLAIPGYGEGRMAFFVMTGV